MFEFYDQDVLNLPIKRTIEVNISEIHFSTASKVQSTLLAKTTLHFSVNETKFIKIIKNTTYDICTDGLNGCTSSIIILKNNIGELFVISSHFPPIDFMREKQLANIKISFLSHKNQIGNIDEVTIFSVTDISRKNDDYQKIIDLLNELTGIPAKNIVSRYNRFDFKRSDKEQLGKMSISISENSEVNFVHEGKKV